MNRKALCISVVVFTILIFAGNHLAVSRFIADQKKSCECSHLKGLEADLSNAVYLQRAFRNQIPGLRKLAKMSALGEYQRIAQNLARKVKRPPGYTGPDTVDFTPWGDNVYSDENLGRYSNEKLCEPSQNTKQDLERAEEGAICAEDAAAIRAHEDVHQQMCRSKGYRAYRDMHPADRAAEEGDAYEAQIKVLRAVIETLSRSCPQEIGYNSGQSTDAVTASADRTLVAGGPALTQQMTSILRYSKLR